ncbi:MAG: HAD family phosphatase [Chloroflexota bacterium]|nr:MAG: HAD family phosphatase [Chloroflexota bacterium]
MRRIQCLIFDMDGLLVDSEPMARQAWEKVVEPYGLVLDEETYSRMVGLRLEETSYFLQARLDIPAEPAELARQKEAHLAQLSIDGVPSMPGLDSLMDELQLRQIPWGVATSNRRAFATQVLQQLGLWSTCKSLTTGQDVQHGKPAPDIYLLAAERMRVAPGFCLALEDSVPGARAARAAGMVTVAIPGSHEKVEAFDFVDFVHNSLGDVAEDLETLMATIPSSS